MRRDEAIRRLKAIEPELRARGVGALYLFGSVARDEAGEGSDVDVMFEDAPGRLLSLFEMAGVKLLLQDRLAATIDLSDRNALHFMLRDGIEAESLKVF